ncbi:MAG: hypothetical protein LBN42_00320 [Oscillospiraceae bacterium]|jgi:hypothetical protein|nr:hypothetical protein [Oscillospiraceae bacterium]
MRNNGRFTEQDSIEARRRRAERRRQDNDDMRKLKSRNWLIGGVAILAALAFMYFGK